MRIDESLYAAFQEEMAALDRFRMTCALIHPSAGLEPDDPDVKRLMEAMAFFGARSRLSAERHVLSMRQRLFRQFFSYLLSPLPVMGLLQARPTGQLADALTLPRGSQFLIQTGKGRDGYVCLLHDLRILPLSIIECATLYRPDRGFRLLLRLKAPYARSDDIGLLRIHISHLNDFKSSLSVLHALEKHLVRAAVVYDAEVNETTQGLSCPVSFGLPDVSSDDADREALAHPVERERLRIHFPRQELFLNVAMAPSPTGWTLATLCLDLDADWPRELILNRDIFQLFVVPVVNLKQEFGAPITCNGSRERHAIFHPQPERGYALHSVLGVYELQDQGMVPLMPGIFFGGNGSYEVDYAGQGSQETPFLSLTFPDAFERSRRIVVDGLWHQPWLDEALHRRGRVLPFSRQTTGVDWDLAGPTAAHQANPFLGHYDGFVQLLTLMNKMTFDLADIKALLGAAGMAQAAYGEAMDQLSDVRCEVAPVRTGQGGTQVRQIYRFVFRDPGQMRWPLIASFSRHAERILNAWVADRMVTVEVEGLAPASGQQHVQGQP